MTRAYRTVLLLIFAGAVWLAMTAAAHAADPTTEACFTAKINGARSSAGLPSLTTRSDLVTIARRHSQRMANSGTIFHNSNLANEAPSDWESLGENVGMGPTCEDIHRAFMNSPSHRKNILDPDFNFVGVGVVIASDGTIYVTEVFMEASQPAPSQPAPTSSTTKSSTSKTTTTKSSTPRTKSGGAAAPPPAPPPPPPPPPGSQVPSQTKAYMDRLEFEPLPSDEELDRHRALLEQKSRLAARSLMEDKLAREEKQGLLARLGALLAAALSGSV